MEDKILKIRGWIVLGFIAFAVFVWEAVGFGLSSESDQYLKVVFFDVGQGDAVFIETPNGRQALIDGGADSGVLRHLSKEMGFFDRSLDVVVGTHPDNDHIGGLVDVFARYNVASIITSENKSDTSVSEMYEKLIFTEDAEIVFARTGQVIELDASTTLKVLFPSIDPSEMESNSASIVIQLVYGDTTFLFTGDSPKNIEDYLADLFGIQLQSDVLKIGHHGSDTSTSELFLGMVKPKYGVISASADNRYGHPHKAVMDLLKKYKVEVVSTAESGNIVFLSDGEKVWIE